MTFRDLAVMCSVHTKHISKLPFLDHGTHRLSRRSKAHRKRGHESYAVFQADRLHCPSIGKVGFNWLLTKDLALGFGGHLYQFPVMSVLRTDQYSIKSFGQQI